MKIFFSPARTASSSMAWMCASWLCTPPGESSPRICSAVPCCLAVCHGLDQRGVGVEAAVLDGQIDFGQVLVHHAPGADVQMADFRIAHLAVGQADMQFGGVDQGVRILTPQLVPVRLARMGDGIEVGILAIAETIEDEQKDGSGCWSGAIGHAGFFLTKISKYKQLLI